MGIVAFQYAFDALVRFGTDAELDSAIVTERDVIPFFVVGLERVRAVFGVAWEAEVSILVVVFHRPECLRHNTLRGVFDEVGVVSHAVGDVVPIHTLLGEADGFVVRPPRFERGGVQQTLVVTLDVELEIQGLYQSPLVCHFSIYA